MARFEAFGQAAALVLLLALPAAAAPPAAAPGLQQRAPRDDASGMRGLFVGGGQRGPINIDARRFEADNKRRTATYVDHVVVRQNDTTLTADRLTVAYDEARRISQVTADGNVRIVQKVPAGAAGEGPTEREAVCGRVVFAVADERITCTGTPASMRQGEDLIRGSRITVLVGDERITVEGDPGAPRVTTRITPKGEAEALRGEGSRTPGSGQQAGVPGQAGARPD